MSASVLFSCSASSKPQLDPINTFIHRINSEATVQPLNLFGICVWLMCLEDIWKKSAFHQPFQVVDSVLCFGFYHCINAMHSQKGQLPDLVMRQRITWIMDIWIQHFMLPRFVCRLIYLFMWFVIFSWRNYETCSVFDVLEKWLFLFVSLLFLLNKKIHDNAFLHAAAVCTTC